jgi:BirA family biotin operon repressor/biotin-[acetyl-CoA-carboxylase] ligase
VELGNGAKRAGYRLIAHSSVGSTNVLAAVALARGDPGRRWFTAERQSRGRGRGGRSWTSPAGNLYASLLLVDPCPPRVAAQLGFVAGIALHRAVCSAAPLAAGRFALKWPNDLLLDGSKLAGILIDGVSPSAGSIAAVIGIGVNIAGHPQDTPYPATDLGAAGLTVTADALFSALSDTLAQGLESWAAGEGFPAVRREWLARAGGLGGPITVRRPEGDRRGIFKDIDGDGRLLLDEGGHTLAVAAGDVFLEGLSTSAPVRATHMDGI